MKKKTFAKLALAGITNGLLLSSLSAAGTPTEAPSNLLQQGTLLAASCKAEGGCSVIANKCGKDHCSTIANKCKSEGGCSAIASNCSSCSAIAARDLSESTTLQAPAQKNADSNQDSSNDPNSENLGYHLLSEDELLLQLNDEGVKQYKALSPEGKALARQVASQRCQGTNECKGLNACQTESNKCAGQGSCKGKSKCAFSDKNVVIKLVTKKMAEKRASSLQ